MKMSLLPYPGNGYEISISKCDVRNRLVSSQSTGMHLFGSIQIKVGVI